MNGTNTTTPERPLLKTAPNGRRTDHAIRRRNLALRHGRFADRATSLSSIASISQPEKPIACSNPKGGYESIVAVLDDSGTRLLTRRESPTDPPNYFIREGATAEGR